jgi:hypothetical protein
MLDSRMLENRRRTLTRIELYETLTRLGYRYEGLPNNQIKIYQKGGYLILKEGDAIDFVVKHAETHCLSCGRALEGIDDDDD